MSGIIKKIFKLFFYLVLVFVIFVASVTGIFVATFDANEYKRDLEQLVRTQTGRDLQFYGDVSLTIYPVLGMKLGALSFSNAKGFGDAPMVKVNKVSISVDVASLFALSPEVDQLVLSDLDINLQKNKAGVSNWDDLVKPESPATTAETTPGEPEPTDAKRGEPLKISGAFGGLNIQNARLLWKDAQAGVEYRVSDLDLTTGRITPDKPFPLSMHVAVQSGSELDAVVDFTSQFQYFFESQRLALNGLNLNVGAKGSLVPFNQVNAEMASGSIQLDPKTGVKLDGLTLKVGARGGLMSFEQLNADIATGAIDVDNQGSVKVGSVQLTLDTKGGEIPFEALNANVSTGPIMVDPKRISLTNLAVKLDGEGDEMPFKPFNANITAGNIDLDPNARSIDLKKLMLALNELQIGGDVTVHDYAQPAVSFKLAAKTLDLDQLLGTPPAGSTPPKTDEQPVATGSAEDVAIKLPMELLRSLKIDGDLSIAKLKIQNLWMQKIRLGINARDGLIDLKPVRLSLYEGNFAAAIQIDAKGAVPKYSVSEKIQGVQVGKLLKDFMANDLISGAMTNSVNIRTQGEWLSELKKNSNGDMSLLFKDGALNGFNLRHMIDTAKAKLTGGDEPEEALLKTDFSSLSLTGLIKDGVFISDDLDLQAPLIRVGGEGKANLNNDTVDYLVNAKIVASLQGQDGGSVDESSGLWIPVRITGPFTAPKIDVQYDEFLKAKLEAGTAKLKASIEAQKAALQKEIDAEKAALKKQLDREKAAQKKKLAAEQALAKKKLNDEKAAAKRKLDAEKAALEAAKQKEIEKQKAALAAKKKAAEEEAKKEAEDKLKSLFD